MSKSKTGNLVLWILVGMEAYIKKLDGHKCMAVLNVKMFEQMIDVKAGLEIIERI